VFRQANFNKFGVLKTVSREKDLNDHMGDEKQWDGMHYAWISGYPGRLQRLN